MSGAAPAGSSPSRTRRYREGAGLGETDAFAASEFPSGRRYDRVVAITRSGTTTEVLELLAALPDEQRTLIIVGDPDSPGATAADDVITLPFADEKSVVQTRFATTALALLRAGLGRRPHRRGGRLPRRAGRRTARRAGRTRCTSPTWATAPTVGLANEAALKMREAALAWAESYPVFDYRHGPISVAEEHSLGLDLRRAAGRAGRADRGHRRLAGAQRRRPDGLAGDARSGWRSNWPWTAGSIRTPRGT